MFYVDFKKFISIVLIAVTLVSVFPLGASALTTNQVTLNMDALKASSYPDGRYWCGGNINTSIMQSGCGRKTTCFCNSFNNAYQCHGFALLMANKAVGSYPSPRLAQYKHGLKSNGWICYTSVGIGKSALGGMGLRPGDVIRASNRSDYSDGHTAIVWKVEGTTVYFAECWGHVYSKIHWGSFNGSYSTYNAISSAYTYIALWRSTAVQEGSTECVHKYTKEGYEAAHPHKKYKICAYCDKTEYTGANQQVSTCVCCNGTHDYIKGNESAHPHKETLTCRRCRYFTYSGNVKTDDNCASCSAGPKNLSASFTAKSYKLGESLRVDFKSDNTVKYKVVIKKDGVNVAAYSDITAKYITHPTEETGVYSATVTAFSQNSKTLSCTTSAVTVKAPITAVTTASDKYVMTYSVAVTKDVAKNFCTSRGITLESHTVSSFTAAVKTNTLLVDGEYIGEYLYVYIPASLSYHEAVDFCKAQGGALAWAENAQTEKELLKFCNNRNTDGILLGATDEASEGTWLTSEGKALDYFNWNISHDSGANEFKNYMFLFPGGTAVEGYAKPSGSYGFVMKTAKGFSYTDNGDGTYTLKSVRATESAQLIIPSVYSGKPVTGIAANALTRGKYTELVLPEKLTTLSAQAFDGATVGCVLVHRGSGAEGIMQTQFPDMALELYIPFTDINKNMWYYTGVEYCYERGYISGVSETKFSPHGNLTREQFVMMLSKLAGADLGNYDDTDTAMTDVPKGKWYSSAIAWAVSEGYVKGVSEGVFGRGQNITREQIARLLYLYAEHNGGDVSARAELGRFTDSGTISDWAYENLSWAVASGIISGTSDTTLAPRGLATRAQAARLMMQFDSVINK